MDNDYHRGLGALRERNKYDSVFLCFLDELSGKVDLGWVKSCVAMGAGSGSHEIAFVQRFLSNLRTFVAFDEDHESVKAFRNSLQARMAYINIIYSYSRLCVNRARYK